MTRMSVAAVEAEKEYLDRVRKYPDQVIWAHEDSVQEGFEFFESDIGMLQLVKDKFLSVGLRNIPRMVGLFARYMPDMNRGRNECFTDLNEYLEGLEETGKLALPEQNSALDENYPNTDLWEGLTGYAWKEWGVTLGFTELARQLIFKGKAVLFRYALVCIQEMDQEKIDLAPKLDAGQEVQRVYVSLGLAVNDIARWLRHNHGVSCQSNHPLAGLVNTTPLAAKAGMGWQGQNGLLITPQYGQRQRIAPILLKDRLFKFTDNGDHRWIENFCETCRKCERACPVQAIHHERQPGIENIPGIDQTRTCIDRLKCYPQFSRTLGCSICIKVCPFSRGNDSYHTIQMYRVV